MEKEIMQMVEKGEGSYRINAFCKLKVETFKGWVSEKITNVFVVFSMDNATYFPTYEIKSRDFNGIISEIQKCTEMFFDKTKRIMIKDLEQEKKAV